MKVGILAANVFPFASPEGAAELAGAAEANGFDSLWTAEHVLWPDSYEAEYPYAPSGKMPGTPETALPDPLVWLTWVAAHSSTIRLATGILIVPQRNPAVLAKQVATLDSLSGGRFLLGIGVGWLREEFEALDVPFEGRGRRTDEYLEVMRKLWAGDSVEHHGEHVSFSGMTSNPKPVGGSVPIVVGGHSKRAAQRAGALGDGFAPLGGDIPELVDIMRQTAADNGRDPAAIEITANHPLLTRDPTAALDELASWGVDRAVVHSYFLGKGTATQRCEEWGQRYGLQRKAR